MPKPDLVAEHAALRKERDELRALCINEWTIMSQQVAKQRNNRLWTIQERLAAIERTKTWKRRDA